MQEKATEAARDTALIETLTFCKSLDQTHPDLLQQLETLYTRHNGKPAAMGLLYGCMEELTRREYSAGRLDLIQQQRFVDLKARLADAIRA